MKKKEDAGINKSGNIKLNDMFFKNLRARFRPSDKLFFF